jgi:hypothetical protein
MAVVFKLHAQSNLPGAKYISTASHHKKETGHGEVTSSAAPSGRPGLGGPSGERRPGSGEQPVQQVLVDVEAWRHRRGQENDQTVLVGECGKARYRIVLDADF